MKISSFQYALRDALRSLWRNKVMSLASIATVAVSLIILGSAWLLVLNTEHLATVMEAELEVNIFLKPEVTREQAVAMKEQFSGLHGVTQVVFVPKEEGLKSLEERFANTNLLQALGGTNPIPDVYRLKSDDPTLVPQIAAKVAQFAEVETVRYGQGMVEKLLALTHWLRTIGLVAIAALALAAVFLIATTIRIAVFARRREIGIMKLVGATNWYIRWPFFLEGMGIGLIGALLAVGVLAVFYSQMLKYVSLAVSFLPVISDGQVLMKIYKTLLLGGTSLGAIGSAISLRRFLKV